MSTSSSLPEAAFDSNSLAPSPEAPGTPLGKSAGLIHGLALAAAAFTALLGWFLDKRQETVYAVLGVGGAAALCGLFWSGVLALRALWNGQVERAPPIVLGLLTLEFSAPWVASWAWLYTLRGGRWYDASFWQGLIVFAPLVPATAIGVLLARWRVRRTDRRLTQAGHPARKPVERWRQGLAWYLAVLLLYAAPLLPCGAYLYCAWMRLWVPTWDVRFLAADTTPYAVRHGVDFFLSLSESKSCQSWRRLLAWSGQFSPERTEDYIRHGDDGMASSALSGMRHTDPPKALELSLSIARGEFRTDEDGALSVAGEIVAEQGDEAQIRELLRMDPPIRTGVFTALIRKLKDRGRVEMLPELELLARGHSPNLRVVLESLSELERLTGREDRISQVIELYLEDSNETRRLEACEIIGKLSAQDYLWLAYLSAKDTATLQATLVGIMTFSPYFSQLNKSGLDETFLPVLARLAKHADPAIRSEAQSLIQIRYLEFQLPDDLKAQLNEKETQSENP
ncbi:MAG: hypothetical protein M5U26_01940 [Planctomycetota bacterium]|nr:hypothetical protein [Planctomycetota bacterium]